MAYITQMLGSVEEDASLQRVEEVVGAPESDDERQPQEPAIKKKRKNEAGCRR